MAVKHHTIISGTGRAGTTFLVQLLTQLGLDTGYSNPYQKIAPHHNGGMERDLSKPDAPYIVKSPALCEYLERELRSGTIIVDHAFVPMRDLFSVAESRRRVARLGDLKFLIPMRLGPWRIRKPSDQENVLAQRFYNLFHTLALHNIPVTTLLFPRLVSDPAYLYTKLAFLVGKIAYEDFASAFKIISRPELVHDFQPQSPISVAAAG